MLFLWAHLQPVLCAISPEEVELPPGTWFAGRLGKGFWLQSQFLSCQSGQEDVGRLGWTTEPASYTVISVSPADSSILRRHFLDEMGLPFRDTALNRRNFSDATPRLSFAQDEGNSFSAMVGCFLLKARQNMGCRLHFTAQASRRVGTMPSHASGLW